MLENESGEVPDSEAKNSARSISIDRRVLVALIAIAVVGTVAVIAFVAMALTGDDGPTITGAEVESILNDQLGAAPGSPVIDDTFRCPRTRSYGDGDRFVCIVDSTNGPMEVPVQLYREGDGWHAQIGVE